MKETGKPPPSDLLLALPDLGKVCRIFENLHGKPEKCEKIKIMIDFLNLQDIIRNT